MFRTGRPATIARSACATKLNPTPAPVFRNVSLARKAAPKPVFPGRQPSMTNAVPATMPAPAVIHWQIQGDVMIQVPLNAEILVTVQNLVAPPFPVK